MLRPRASAAKVSALAAASISPSFLWAIGNRIAAPKTQAIVIRCQVCGGTRVRGAARRSQVKVSPTVMGTRSGSDCCGAAEQPARHNHEPQPKDREDDPVRPAGRKKMPAEALYEADQHAP